ncbi:hypothetical protein GCM10018785_69720 [Streptomyces longispororuber]|uniref:Uncharacterized protein n=1 Tax=Streptomyces longispororuber TaxID=68230 RepID=A0A919DYL4_9ACTN|nr:hypothetical protein GCM10018785_69720 [Streptomyces longispororuber]
MVAVVEAQALGVPAHGGEFGEHGRVDGPLPGRVQHGHRVGVQGADPAPQPARQDLFELAEGAHRALADALDPLPGRGAQAHRDGHGLVVVEQQRGQLGPRAELVAAAGAGAGVDGVAELAQPVHVAADRARGHAEALGEVRARPLPVGLEQREQP